MAYTYKDRVAMGYTKFKLSKKQHNDLFPKRKIAWHDRYEYYYNDNGVILDRFYKWIGIVFWTITFPIAVLIDGLGNFKETVNDFKRMYNQKKHGSFTSDSVSSGSDKYIEIMKIING